MIGFLMAIMLNVSDRCLLRVSYSVYLAGVVAIWRGFRGCTPHRHTAILALMCKIYRLARYYNAVKPE